MNKWVVIGALGNLLLCVLNIVNLVRHWLMNSVKNRQLHVRKKDS